MADAPRGHFKVRWVKPRIDVNLMKKCSNNKTKHSIKKNDDFQIRLAHGN